MLEIRKVNTPSEREQALAIRHEVFVIGQHCPPEEEYDGLDGECLHLLAVLDGQVVGTCRIRKTEKGIKLERFAVLEDARGNGVGKALVRECLELEKEAEYIYLHAQEHALEFYEALGFKMYGDRFWEAGIPHFAMNWV